MKSGSLFGTGERHHPERRHLPCGHPASPPLAVILFAASIVIPVAKLLSLTYLSGFQFIAVRAGHHANERKLYRVLEFVGRWSMIDVYVAAMLTALVQFGGV